jgi:hypothetical protein
VWQSHGKNCPRCQRTLSRASVLERRAGRASLILLVASSLLALAKTIIGQKLTIPLAGGLLSVAFHSVGRWAAQAQERMHRQMSIDDIADVYEY